MSTFKFNNKNVFYQIDGTGPNLVILNGIMMASASWDVFINTLSKHFRVIRVDFFDQGQTDKMDTNYSITLQAELVYALIKHLKIKKTHLTGISYGGTVGLCFASKYPKYIDRLVIFNSVTTSNHHLNDILSGWKQAALERNSEEFYKRSLSVIYSKYFIRKNQEWFNKRKDFLIENFFSNEAFLDGMIRLIDSVSAYDEPLVTKNIKAPTLVIASDADGIMPSGNQFYMASQLSDASLVVLPDVGHASMYEVPRVFVTLLVGFLLIEDLEYNI